MDKEVRKGKAGMGKGMCREGVVASKNLKPK
jgi:hypothetical protein